MPNFPTSVFTPPTRSAGQTIGSAHVNDIQDEINAIEGGYINGTAPLNSSNSTLANLSVTGNSTVTGSMTVSSNVTISGRLTQDTPVAIVKNLGAAIANNVDTYLTFTQQDFVSTSVMHSTATNPGRLLAAASSGVYEISGSVRWNTFSTAGARRVFLRVNGTDTIGSVLGPGSPANDVIDQNLSVLYRLASTTDYVELGVSHNSGSTGSVQDVAWAPRLMMIRIR